MIRKDLIPILVQREWSVAELAELLQEHPKDIETDLDHLLRSLRHEPYEVRIARARCRSCGFELDSRRLRKPGKCPSCRGTWIEPPRIHLLPRH